MRFSISTLVAAAVFASLLAGCDGGSSSPSSTASNTSTAAGTSATTTATTVTVERGPLLFTNLVDQHGFSATSQGNGSYAFTNNTPVYPLKTTGGYIDVNRNGIIDAGDIKAGELSLRSMDYGNAVTIASTLGSDSAIQAKLLTLGFNATQLANNTPSQDKMIAALSDEIYKYVIQNNLTNMSQITTAVIDTLTPALQSRIASYQASTATTAHLEQVLIAELSVLLTDQTITENIDTANQSNTVLVLNSLPVYPLTDVQKESLYYMWNEEKLAKDLYLALNAVYPANALYNIATNSETQHVNSMEGLLAKYQLTQNVVDAYNQATPTAPVTQLSEIPAGVFTLPNLQTLYNTLYQEGIISANAALQAGCKVEVTDVTDLNQDIIDAGNAKDLVTFFEILRAGSYNHYWSFDNALIKAGITNGCLSAGVDGSAFPKTSINGGGANAGGAGSGTGNQFGRP